MTADRARSIVGDSEGRPENDFYPTNDEYTQAMLDRVTFQGAILEPACGEGDMVMSLRKRGYKVVASDIVDYGFDGARSGLDFLTLSDSVRVPNVVTNPPFKIAMEFARKATTIATGKVALLCKIQFLAGVKRAVMHQETHLTKVYVFPYRPKFGRNGEIYKNGGMIDFAWYIWEKGYVGDPTVHWL